jgi:hypothetical protein
VTDSGIPRGSGNGQVAISGLGAGAYTVVGNSKSGNKFTIAKSGGTVSRSCTTVGKGGCPSGGATDW